MPEIDLVNHPPHYGKGRFGIECITLTRHLTFCAGNAVKYIWRWQEKGGLEDLEKAIVYLGWAHDDGVPAILPGSRLLVQRMVAYYIEPAISPAEAYSAIPLVVVDRFDSAQAHLECFIDHYPVQDAGGLI